MKPVTIIGLRGDNPLDFLAAIGLQGILAEQQLSREPAPRLRWDSKRLYPIFSDVISCDELVEVVRADCLGWSSHPCSSFRYLKKEKKGLKECRALTSPVGYFRRFSEQLLQGGEFDALHQLQGLVCEICPETIKPDRIVSWENYVDQGISVDVDSDPSLITGRTFFDFTARNTQFLDQISKIAASLSENPQQIQDELFEPKNASGPAFRRMSWDSTREEPGAQYSAKAKSRVRPTCEWLMFRGLRYLPLRGSPGRLVMPLSEGRRKSGAFYWPLWSDFCSARESGLLISVLSIDTVKAAELRAMGIHAVFSSGLVMDSTGYGGMFAPSAPFVCQN